MSGGGGGGHLGQVLVATEACGGPSDPSEPHRGDPQDPLMSWPPPSTLPDPQDPSMSWPSLSTLPDTPFPSRALATVAAVAEVLLAPGYWSLDRLLALLPTTAQRQPWRSSCGHLCLGVGSRLLVAPLLLLALLLALPLALLGLLLWLPVQAKRRPFVHQFSAGVASPEPWDPRWPRGFTFVTANLCLLPSGLARFSNLGNTRRRAVAIGQRLASGAPAERSGHREGLLEQRRGQAGGGYRGYGGTEPRDGELGLGATRGDPWSAAGAAEVAMAEPPPVAHAAPMVGSVPTLQLPVTVSGAAQSPVASAGPERAIPLAEPIAPVLTTRIPADTDFVCLQEVFDPAAATILRRQLARRFPHVLWGVGPGGLRCGQLRLLGSGLVLGSRWPLLAARFHSFPNGAGEDALANKGLLVAQVLLGTGKGWRVVGYLGCTHLQAPAADATIRDKQLSLVLRWLHEFRREQEQRGDLVAFDVLCGDLNFDNCSRGDTLNQQHSLFTEFWDPARLDCGRDQPWAIGTLLNYLKIYEEPVSDPEKMERTLSQPWGQEQFLACPILACGAPDPLAPRPWRGRRVDLALLRRDPPLATEVTGLSVITHLATLTDHLPVALRLRLGPADLCPRPDTGLTSDPGWTRG